MIKLLQKNREMINVHKIESSEERKIAFEIRESVFVLEQGVDKEDEYDDFENESTHFLAFDNNKAVGTARWRKVGDNMKLERFAVLREARGIGVGEALVNAVIDDLKNYHGVVYLHSQVHALQFYEKQGFYKQGDLFLECDIQHYKMIYGKG